MAFSTDQLGQTHIRVRDIDVHYYLRESSPDRWNAIGVLSGVQPSRASSVSTSPPMIVGVGATPDEAIGNLIARVLRGDHPELATLSVVRQGDEIANAEALDAEHALVT